MDKRGEEMDREQHEKMVLTLNGFGNERLLRLADVAVEIGCSVYTINNWYRFKRANPDNKYAKLLPDFYQPEGARQTRYWRKSDIPKLIDFKNTIPRGSTGVMGCITQKYYKRKAHDDGQD